MRDPKKKFQQASAEEAKNAYYEDGASIQDRQGNTYHLIEEAFFSCNKLHHITYADGSISISSAEPDFEFPGSIWFILPKK
jgi:hypothetical protein